MSEENTNPKPNRPADEELSGEGKAPPEIQDLAASAYHAELFIDAMGDPEHAPRGWWYLKLWKAP